MRVIKTFTMGKNPVPIFNEDRIIGCKNTFYGVVDGATSRIQMPNGRSGGILAAETVEAYFADADPTLDPVAHVAALTRCMVEAIGPWEDKTIKPPCATFAVYIPYHRVVLRVGDCQFRIDDEVYASNSAMDALQSAYRSAVTRGRLGLGLVTLEDEKRRSVFEQAFRELLDVHAYFLNNAEDPLGFGAISNMPTPAKFIQVCKVPEGAKRLILCTDGFLSPPANLQAGLDALHQLREEDPVICYTDGLRPFVADCEMAIFDDTTYLELAL